MVERLARNWRCSVLPPGDDAACLELGGWKLVLKIDGYSVSRSKLPWMTWRDVGWKSVVAAASDIIAKGGRPLVFMLSLGLHPGMRVEDALDIVEGALEAAERLGAWIAGGDTNAASEDWIDVAGVGVAVDGLIGVNPAPGDVLYTTVGRYGLTGLAFHLLRTGRAERIAEYPAAHRETRRPDPRVEFLELVEELRGCITWASDVSDGFCATLRRLEDLTGLRVVLERLPSLHEEAVRYARQHNLDPVELLLAGGEEYEIVFSVRRECVERIERLQLRTDITLERIGFIVHVPDERNIRTVVEGRLEGEERIKLIKLNQLCVRTGWDQFTGWV